MEFDKKFVHCVYEEELVGKTCVFADDIATLKVSVEACDEHYIAILGAHNNTLNPDELTFQFYNEKIGTSYRFVYYDPNFEVKIAHEQGKQIQYFSDDEWHDVDDPTWNPDIQYRVKPDEPASDDVRAYVPYESVSEMMYAHFNVDCVEDIKNCIWVRPKDDTSVRLMVTGMDVDRVLVDDAWIELPDLLEQFLWDDYAPIGKCAQVR